MNALAETGRDAALLAHADWIAEFDAFDPVRHHPTRGERLPPLAGPYQAPPPVDPLRIARDELAVQLAAVLDGYAALLAWAASLAAGDAPEALPPNVLADFLPALAEARQLTAGRCAS